MSRWAANNPEEYSEIVNRGIAKHIGLQTPFSEEEILEKLSEIEFGSPEDRSLYMSLLANSSVEIQQSEANFHARHIDDVRERDE